MFLQLGQVLQLSIAVFAYFGLQHHFGSLFLIFDTFLCDCLGLLFANLIFILFIQVHTLSENFFDAITQLFEVYFRDIVSFVDPILMIFEYFIYFFNVRIDTVFKI